MRHQWIVVVVALAACSERSASSPAPNPLPTSALNPAPDPVVHVDAGAVFATESAVGDVEIGSRPLQSSPVPERPGRPIDVTLRSSPPGAEVAVDGTVIGRTPAFWSGVADGREHQFVFTLRGHSIARYRFVPVASGVIHGRLEPISEERDAGVPPVEVMQHPSQAPPSSTPKPPVVAPLPVAPAPGVQVDARPAGEPVPLPSTGPQP